MGIKYDRHIDGERIYPKQRGYRMMCCDCGLVHRIVFKIIKNGKQNIITYVPYRDNKATAAARKGKNIKIKILK